LPFFRRFYVYRVFSARLKLVRYRASRVTALAYRFARLRQTLCSAPSRVLTCLVLNEFTAITNLIGKFAFPVFSTLPTYIRALEISTFPRGVGCRLARLKFRARVVTRHSRFRVEHCYSFRNDGLSLCPDAGLFAPAPRFTLFYLCDGAVLSRSPNLSVCILAIRNA